MRQVKYARYRQPDSSLLLGGQCLPQSRSGESRRILKPARSEQRNRAPRDKGTTERMPRRRQFECSPGELGGTGRITRTENARSLEQGSDGGFIARLGAVGELLRHLDGKRALS